MENSIYIGLSRQMTLMQDLNVVSQNVANVNTPGYRAQNMLFQEFISDPRGGDDELSFAYDGNQYQDTEPGSVSFTSNPLDLALDGPGFFNVSGPGGEVVYTRAGNFQINANGELITSEGFLVDGGGSSISIPQGTKDVNIDDNGFVSGDGGILGQIGITEFPNVQELEAIGNNLYKAPNGSGIEAEDTRVRQGHLEGSNVKPVIEMTKMIELLRTFQATQNVLQTENDRLRGAIQKLTRSN